MGQHDKAWEADRTIPRWWKQYIMQVIIIDAIHRYRSMPVVGEWGRA